MISTKSCTRNDLIDSQIKDFCLTFLKMDIWNSSSDFSLFFRPNLNFKDSLDAEMSIDEVETKRF